MANQEIKSMERKSQENSNSSDKIGQNAADKPEESVMDGIERKPISKFTDFGNGEKGEIFKINSYDAMQNNVKAKPPQVNFKPSSKSKHPLSKKTNGYKHATKLKQSNKQSNRRRMNENLEGYINGENANLSKGMNQTITESLSKIASSCPMLKQVPANGSIIEDLNQAVENIDENNEDQTPSLCSESSISNISQKTITFKIGNESSETLNVDESSVMCLLDQPIKTNVINIARAQVDHISFGDIKRYDTLIGQQDLDNNIDSMYIPRESTPYSTSIETLGHSSDQGSSMASSEPSSITLVDEAKEIQPFSKDNNRFYQSNFTSLSQSDITLRMEHLNMNESSEKHSKVSLSSTKKTLMDTVNSLGMFPEMTTQRSANNFNDVIVAERVITNFNPLVKETDERQTIKFNQNYDSNGKPIKSVVKSLDNAAKLEKLRNTSTTDAVRKLDQKYDTCTDKSRNGHPSSIAELWEHLAEALDLKVQKLEKSLTDTILSEIKETFSILETFKNMVNTEKEAKVIDIEKSINKLLNKLDEDLQCNLINEPGHPNSTDKALSGMLLKDTIGVQYKFEPSYEILKPAVKSAGDSQDFISVVVDKPIIAHAPRGHRIRPPLAAVRYFFKENFIVLVGAPVFLGTIVCIYFIVVLIVNWV